MKTFKLHALHIHQGFCTPEIFLEAAIHYDNHKSLYLGSYYIIYIPQNVPTKTDQALSQSESHSPPILEWKIK